MPPGVTGPCGPYHRAFPTGPSPGGGAEPIVHVVVVAAARPNFMKVKPVLDGLERRSVECTLVHTGQHYDPAMSEVFFDDLGIRAPDHHLGVG